MYRGLRRLSSPAAIMLLLLLVAPLSAATRFYLANGVSAAVTPSSWSAGWTTTTGGDGPWVCRTVNGGTANADLSNTNDASGTANFVVQGRFVSDALAAQTIDGTLIGVTWGNESNGAAQATFAVAAKVIKSDGTDRGVLLGVSASDLVDTLPPEFNTGARTRICQDSAENTSLTLSSVNAEAGDRLVIELGYRETGTSAAHTVVMRVGETGTDFGHLSNGTTDSGVVWVEFSDTITFQAGNAARSLLLSKRRR